MLLPHGKGLLGDIAQTWTWVESIYGLGWVGLDFDGHFVGWVEINGLGFANYNEVSFCVHKHHIFTCFWFQQAHTVILRFLRQLRFLVPPNRM